MKATITYNDATITLKHATSSDIAALIASLNSESRNIVPLGFKAINVEIPDAPAPSESSEPLVSNATYDFTGIQQKELGDLVWFNHEYWVLVHHYGGIYYLMRKEVTNCKPYRHPSAPSGCELSYDTSMLSDTIRVYEDAMNNDSSNQCIITCIDMVDGKLFAPTYSQITQVFDYFRDSVGTSNRIGLDKKGDPCSWWLASTDNGSKAYYVDEQGNIRLGSCHDYRGIRLFAAVFVPDTVFAPAEKVQND